MDGLRRAEAALAVRRRIDRADLAERHNHAGDVRALHLLQKNLLHLLDGLVLEVLDEEDARLLAVADEAVRLLQKIAPLNGDRHVRDDRVDGLVILLRIGKDALDDLLVHVQLKGNAVGVSEDLVALLVEQRDQRTQVGALADGGTDIAVVVEHSQPRPHAVRCAEHVVGVDLVVAQLAHDVLAEAGVVDKAHKCRAQLDIRDILGHVAAHAARHLLDAPGVAPAGDIDVLRIALDVHEHRAQYNNAHRNPPAGGGFAPPRYIIYNV